MYCVVLYSNPSQSTTKDGRPVVNHLQIDSAPWLFAVNLVGYFDKRSDALYLPEFGQIDCIQGYVYTSTSWSSARDRNHRMCFIECYGSNSFG